jgi:hypothetical protein
VVHIILRRWTRKRLLAEGKDLVERAAPTASRDRLKAQVERYCVDDIER